MVRALLRRAAERVGRQRNPISGARVLVLTPIKDAERDLPSYVANLFALTYPHALVWIGMLESDSRDGTFARAAAYLPMLRREFADAALWKHDYSYLIPEGMHRAEPSIQTERRAVLARSRNRLLVNALRPEHDWVLWLDADVREYPPDLIERLLATGREIVHPHCVLDSGGPTFDRNAWRDRGALHLDDLRAAGELVELDTVGGTVLLVRADLHRDGLIFPPFRFGLANPRIRDGGEIETEGLGIMAREMGVVPWGMPHLEVRHRRH